MNTLKVPEKDITIEFAERLEELKPEDWLFYCELIYKLEQGEISNWEFQVAWLYCLLNMRPEASTKLPTVEKTDNVAYLLSQLTNFFEYDRDQLVIHTTCVVNLLPDIGWPLKGARETFQGPGDLLHKMTFGRFLSAYRVYMDYLENKNGDALPELTNILYGMGDRAAKLPPWYHLSTLYFFQSCVAHITTQPLVVYGQELDIYKVFKQGGDAKETPDRELPFDPVLFDLGENGVFGSVDKLKEQELFEVLRYLYRKHLQGIEEKRKNAQRKRPK